MRETRFTILKALAIIFVVLSHAGVPGWLNHFLFIFHVPVFFIGAGYFFHTKYVTDERTFVVHRVKGLYWPFLRWSLFFLIIHNLLFKLGILNETFGNASGGVLHPYNWQQFSQHLWSIVVNMSGYNDFLCGTFWFFRALLLASLAFLLLFKLFGRSERFRNDRQIGWAILITAIALAVWKISCGLTATGISQGGLRELTGLMFMACGFLIKQYGVVERLTWKWAVPSFLLLLLAAAFFPSMMGYHADLSHFLRLPVPAVAGFLAFLYASILIDERSKYAKRALVYIGDRTLYIFAFHLVAFKAVSALKVWIYGLPWEAVGGHPYVLSPANNFGFVLLYTAAGVGLPLLWLAGYQMVASRITFTEKEAIDYSIVGAQKVCHLVYMVGRGIALITKASVQAIIDGVKAVKDASNPKEE